MTIIKGKIVSQSQPSFSFNRTDYPANEAPVGIVAADVDGDGDQDLVVANPGTDPRFVNPDTGNQISVLRNNGDGTFAAPVSFTTGVGPSVTAGDLDGDRDVDLATANSTDDTVSILRNDGSGNFAAPVNFATGDNPMINAPADLDGDGDLDLITTNTVAVNRNTANNSGNTISILRNNSDGSFAAPETLTAGNGVINVKAADLDADGDLDIVTANQGENTLSVLSNNGNGTFAAPVKLNVGIRPNSVVVADLDGNGNLDLAATNFDGGNVSVLKNNGDGGTFTPNVFSTEPNPDVLQAADLDGDGDLDLTMRHVITNITTGDSSGNTISILRNNGDGSFAAPESLPVGNVPSGLVVADLNGSGNPDLATPNFDSDSITVYLSQGTVSERDPFVGSDTERDPFIGSVENYVFNQSGTEGNTITNFQPGVDQIVIDTAAFNLSPGVLATEQLTLASVALDSSGFSNSAPNLNAMDIGAIYLVGLVVGIIHFRAVLNK